MGEHKHKQVLPDIKQKVLGQSLDVIEEPSASTALPPDLLIRLIDELQNGVE